MSKNTLSKHELNEIKRNEEALNDIFSAIKHYSQFKTGDYLIGYWKATSWEKRAPVINSYGVKTKFQVVHIDEHGLPYIKEINNRGKTQGDVLIPLCYYSEEYENGFVQFDYEFELDPDYADAILFEDEAGYDPVKKSKEQSDLRKEIVNYNKTYKLNTHSIIELRNTVSKFKVNDVFWVSGKNWIRIDELTVPKTYNGFTSMGAILGKATTSKGEQIVLTSTSLKNKTLYSQRPRSFNELKDPK